MDINDHLGVRAYIFEDDISGLDNRLSKGLHALNAISGLGIRRNGLTIYACCVVFWSIVIPIAKFGADVWPFNDKSLSMLESFQTFVGKRIQRFYPKSPNLCTYFTLRWIRIHRFIEIKKLLFIHLNLSRDVDVMVKVVFMNHAKFFFSNTKNCEGNEHGSIVYDLLNTVILFGFSEEVKNMVYRGHLYNRAHCRERIWKRAWKLEDVYWCIEARCHKSLEMINKICITSWYLVWWQLSDRFHYPLKECEIMAKLLCHASLLRTDDVRLKRLPMTSKFCPLCDHGAMDDPFHMVMQCPALQAKRNVMFHEIEQICAV